MRNVCLAIAVLACGASSASAQVRLKDICEVKGQEPSTIHGMGLVIGLKGTGDGGAYLPTMRSLARAMDLMGHPLGSAVELKDAKNVALVMVSVTIPGAGAREGQLLNCEVSSIGAAKSLANGRLFMTPLLGPDLDGRPAGKDAPVPQVLQVYGFAEGALHLDDPQFPTTARVHAGCRLEREFLHEFVKDNKITLRLKASHADFEVATEIAELVNGDQRIASGQAEIARALDQLNIEIEIPRQYSQQPAQFVAEVLKLSVSEPQIQAQVVINERAGSVVISGDVEIGAAVVTHKNIVIETGDNLPIERFPIIDPEGGQSARLKELVAALNSVKVSTADIIEIIKGLERNGKLHAKLIIE